MIRTAVGRRGDFGVYDLDKDPDEGHLLKASVIGHQDPRLVAAKRLWQQLDRLAETYDRVDAGEMPEALQADLSAAGYTWSGNEDEPDQPDQPDQPKQNEE